MKRTALRRDAAELRRWQQRSRERAAERARQGRSGRDPHDPLPAPHGPPRTGEVVPCPVCGDEFYLNPSDKARGRTFCSKACSNRDRAQGKETRTCKVCGEPFEAWKSDRRRKHCSAECARVSAAAEKRGKKNPNYRHGNGQRKAAWRAAKEAACRACGGTRRLLLHHVVYEQHVERMGGDVYDPDNSYTVCFGCHMAHHGAPDFRITTDTLRPENFAFAAALLGAYAPDYIARYYDAGDRPPWVVQPAHPDT